MTPLRADPSPHGWGRERVGGLGREAGYWSPEQRGRYARAIAIAVSKVNRLQGQALRDVRSLLEDLRSETVDRMVWAQQKAEAGGSTFDLARIGALQQEIQVNFIELQLRFPAMAAELANKVALAEAQAVDAPIVAAMGTDPFRPFALSRSIAGASALVQANLVTRVSQETVRKISNEISLAATGLKTPFEAMQAVGRNLDDPSIFGDIATRAEAIVVTELGRVQSVAGQARQEEAAQVVRDMSKQWAHGPIRPGSRPGHVAVHGQIRDVHQDFDVEGEKLMFPRDPRGSPGNTIFCHCSSLPYIVGLSEPLDTLGAIAA